MPAKLPGATDILGSGSCAQYDGFSDVIQTGAHRHSNPPQIHTDQRSTNIQTGISLDGFHGNWILKSVPGSDGHAFTSMRLWHHIDNLIALGFGCGTFHDQRTVQLFASLYSQIDTLALKGGIDAFKRCLRCIHRRTSANLLSDNFWRNSR